MVDEALHPDRHLKVDGAYNVRDIGGYPTRSGGQTRWRQFLRADSLHALTDSGRNKLIDYGMSVVVDLRMKTEVDRRPNVFADRAEVDYQHLPFLDKAAIAEAERKAEKKAEKDRTHFVADKGYRSWLDQCQPLVCAIMTSLSTSTTGSALYHCAGGKDRTGLVSALLLGLADVAPEVIAADYALTARHNIHSYLAGPEDKLNIRTWQDYEERLCPPEIMLTTLVHLDENYGGIESYVRTIGLGDEQIQQLRSKLIA